MARAKVEAAIALLGCLALGLYLEGHRPQGSGNPGPANSTTAVAEQPAPPSTDPPPVQETPYRIVMRALDREAFPDVEVKGSTVHVRYHIDPWMLTEATGRRAFDRNAAELVPGLFARFPKISTVTIAADASRTDIRGAKGRSFVASVTFTRRNAGAIHWGAINVGDIGRLADDAWYDSRFR